VSQEEPAQQGIEIARSVAVDQFKLLPKLQRALSDRLFREHAADQQPVSTGTDLYQRSSGRVRVQPGLDLKVLIDQSIGFAVFVFGVEKARKGRVNMMDCVRCACTLCALGSALNYSDF
jgi:hypothetical protein